MPWEDKIVEAAYTSPSGVRVVMGYEDVSREFDTKTTAYTFTGTNGSYIQDLGRSGRRFPFRAIFWGEDYDLEANLFEAVLREKGVGKLEHPIYGTYDVVPSGKVSRKDALKSGANQAIVELAFFETTGLVYPASTMDAEAGVKAALAAFNTVAAEQFSDSMSLLAVIDKAIAISKHNFLLDGAKSALKAVAAVNAGVSKRFDAINDSIKNSMDILIADPLTLAFQTLQMVQAPGRAFDLIGARLEAYGNLYNSLIGQEVPESPGLGNDTANGFHQDDLFATGAVSSTVLSSINAEFESQSSAIETAEQILAALEEVVVWQEANYAVLATADTGQVDTGGAYQALKRLTFAGASYLLGEAFSLKQERSIVLDRARTIVDLAAQLFPGVPVDDNLDILISMNALTGSEILELPKGKEIVYLV